MDNMEYDYSKLIGKIALFENKFIRYKGTSSSGVEGQYFIFDATSDS